MKRWIHAAAEATDYKSYSNVNDALETLFGISFSEYGKVSPWIDSKYGLVQYEVLDSVGRSDTYDLIIKFDSKDTSLSDAFVNKCQNEGIEVYHYNKSSQHPQVILDILKEQGHTKEIRNKLPNFIVNSIQNYLGDLGEAILFPNGVGNGWLRYELVIKLTSHVDSAYCNDFDDFVDDLLDHDVKDRFPSVVDCKMLKSRSCHYYEFKIIFYD